MWFCLVGNRIVYLTGTRFSSCPECERVLWLCLCLICNAEVYIELMLVVLFQAFRRLAISMDKVSKVISEEVPGTLSSLKLSGLEINDLTSQLKYLR